MNYLFLLFLALGCSTTYAKSPLIFNVLPSDLSLQYIYFLFGPITDVAPALMQVNSITTLMSVFISAIIYFSMTIIAFVSFQSVFIGSSEGNLLGERMPSLDGPVKMGLSILALIPNNYGFCAIQYFVMWVILNGIGLANQIWGQVVLNYSLGSSLTQDAFISSSSKTEDVTRSLMYAALATAYMRSEMGNTPLNEQAVAENQSGLPVYLCNLATLGKAVCDQSTGIVEFPVKDPGAKAVTSTETLTSESLSVILQNIMEGMMTDPLVQYALANGLNAQSLSQSNVETFFGQEYCTFVLNQYATQLQSQLAPFTKKSTNTQDTLNDMLSQGWMSAAFYYWDLNNSSSGNPGPDAILNDLASTSSALVRNSIYGYGLGSTTANIYYMGYAGQQPAIAGYIDTLYSIKNQSTNGSSQYNQIITDGSSYGVNQMFAMTGTNMLISAFISGDMSFYEMDYDFTVDRYSAFIQSNYKVVSNVISFMQSLVMALFVFAFIAGAFRGSAPLFFSVVFAIISAFFLIMPFISAIAVTGAMGSIYAAALPGLIFGAAAFAWFLKVIEAVVAAPIIAMMMAIPHEDSERKMEHVFMQLVVLAVRPSLMILGLVIASKLCQLSIMFIGGAFNQLGNTISSISSGSNGSASGGIIFLVMMYEFTTMTTITFISRAFNIINLLPDSIFMAIRVQVGDQEADGLIEGFEQAGDKGAKALGQMVTILSGIGSAMNGFGKWMKNLGK